MTTLSLSLAAPLFRVQTLDSWQKKARDPRLDTLHQAPPQQNASQSLWTYISLFFCHPEMRTTGCELDWLSFCLCRLTQSGSRVGQALFGQHLQHSSATALGVHTPHVVRADRLLQQVLTERSSSVQRNALQQSCSCARCKWATPARRRSTTARGSVLLLFCRGR